MKKIADQIFESLDSKREGELIAVLAHVEDGLARFGDVPMPRRVTSSTREASSSGATRRRLRSSSRRTPADAAKSVVPRSSIFRETLVDFAESKRASGGSTLGAVLLELQRQIARTRDAAWGHRARSTQSTRTALGMSLARLRVCMAAVALVIPSGCARAHDDARHPDPRINPNPWLVDEDGIGHSRANWERPEPEECRRASGATSARRRVGRGKCPVHPFSSRSDRRSFLWPSDQRPSANSEQRLLLRGQHLAPRVGEQQHDLPRRPRPDEGQAEVLGCRAARWS